MDSCEAPASAMARGLIVIGLIAALFAQPARATEPVTLDRCDECHEPEGKLREPWMPLIYGQPRPYVRRMLEQFKAGSRPGPDMYRELSGYSREQLDELADMVSRRAPVLLAQRTDPYLSATARPIYEERCMYCHPDEGRGSEFESAILAGQPLEYLRRQFESIIDGSRPVLYVMQDNYFDLGHDDFEALAHFFASRSPHGSID